MSKQRLLRQSALQPVRTTKSKGTTRQRAAYNLVSAIACMLFRAYTSLVNSIDNETLNGGSVNGASALHSTCVDRSQRTSRTKKGKQVDVQRYVTLPFLVVPKAPLTHVQHRSHAFSLDSPLKPTLPPTSQEAAVRTLNNIACQTGPCSWIAR